MNKHLLGVDIDSTPKMDGQWYKITEPLMQTSCDTLRSKVLSRIATQDLTSMQVQLHRIGGTDWGHVSSTDALMTFAPNPAWSVPSLHPTLRLVSPCLVSPFLASASSALKIPQLSI